MDPADPVPMATPREPSARWEHFRHGADIGVRGFGPTLSCAFEQAALALVAVITDPAAVQTGQTVAIELKASSPDLMLFDWLNALVLEMATRQMIFGAFEVAIDGHGLVGRAHGENVSPERHDLAVEVKGATMTELSVVEEKPGWWRAQCVVDV